MQVGSTVVPDPNIIYPTYGDYAFLSQRSTEPTLLSSYNPAGNIVGQTFNDLNGVHIINTVGTAPPLPSDWGGFFMEYVGDRFVAFGGQYKQADPLLDYEFASWEEGGMLQTFTIPNFTNPAWDSSTSPATFQDINDLRGLSFMGFAGGTITWLWIDPVAQTVTPVFDLPDGTYINAGFGNGPIKNAIAYSSALNQFSKVEFTALGANTITPFDFDDPTMQLAVGNNTSLAFQLNDYAYYLIQYDNVGPLASPFLVRIKMDLTTYDTIALSYDATMQAIFDDWFTNQLFQLNFAGSVQDGKIYMVSGPVAGGVTYGVVNLDPSNPQSHYQIKDAIRLGCWSPCINVGYKE